MNQNTKDPLADLFSDDVKSIDRGTIAAALKPYIILDRNTGAIAVLPAFEKVNGNAEKIEIILMASKALSLLIEGQRDGMTQGQITAMDIMPEGSVKSTLKKLFDSKKTKKNSDDSGYYIPNYRINEVLDRLNKFQK
jgi:hypothetical protein